MMDTRPLHVLLVEDDEVDIMNVRRAFERKQLHHPVHVARNGIEALAALRGGALGPRRIVLLDLNMPRMNGLEFLEALRRDALLTGTPVVVLTTSSEEQDKLAAYRSHVAGYLVKPVTLGRFLDEVGALNDYWTRVELP